jgi:phenylalanyl-tRNA synthetase beta chain
MQLSYSWLNQYLDHDLSPEQVKDALTQLGLEVGKMESIGGVPGDLAGVVVGQVLSADPHPNADRLRICQVDIGAESPLPIVCGAANVAKGQKVAVATVGTTLYPFGQGADKGLKIKKGSIRGEVSLGMICAEDELGLGPSHDGIMVLPDQTAIGQPLREVVTLDEDVVLEIDLTPNRVDGASHYGAARDLAAYLRTQPKLPPLLSDEGLSQPNPIPVTIHDRDRDRCQRYTSIYLEGVTVGDSPEWLNKRLVAIGLRPINNVVDVTNFVLHELGHPLHAFDADQLKGRRIEVKTLAQATTFTTLDGEERSLLPGQDLMICDAEGPRCIAGVMGGLNSGVTRATKNIFLESAYFDPGTVRRTAKRLGLSTDSSFRFERGADPHMTETAARRAAYLIMEVAGGQASQVADEKLSDFPPFEVALSVAKTERLIGKAIGRDTIIGILEALEIGVSGEGDQLHLLVPRYRVDVQRDVDVIEDILRVYGYNHVELPGTFTASLGQAQYRDLHEMQERYANYLSANGFYEILTNSLVSVELGDDQAVPIVNPLSEELGIMRQSLLPGALDTVRHNQNRQQENLALYEFGKTYGKTTDGYTEHRWLALTVSGAQHAMHWRDEAPQATLGTLAREAARIQHWFGFQGELREIEHPDFDYGLELVHGGQSILHYGCVTSAWKDKYDLRQEVFFMLVDWPRLLDLYFAQAPTYQPIPLYPSIRRDLSLLIDPTVSFADIAQRVYQANPKLIRSVELHDVYMGKGIDPDKKSYLISIELRDDNKTLADQAAEKVTQRVMHLLTKELGAELRG